MIIYKVEFEESPVGRGLPKEVETLIGVAMMVEDAKALAIMHSGEDSLYRGKTGDTGKILFEIEVSEGKAKVVTFKGCK